MPKINSDKQWQLFNKQLENLMKSGDFFGLGAVYYEMADFLKKEGRNDSQLRKLGYQMKLKINKQNLKRYKSNSGILRGVEIIATENSCESCKKLNGKIFSIKEALLSNPLPVENCTYPCGCRCVYGPVVE